MVLPMIIHVLLNQQACFTGQRELAQNKIAMKYRLSLMLSLLFFLACEDEDKPTDCVDPSRATQSACYTNYLPVCGCNGVTYGNACEANAAGVLHYESGECPDK